VAGASHLRKSHRLTFSFLPYIPSGPPAYGMVLPTFRIGLPPLVNPPLEMPSQIYPEACLTNLPSCNQVENNH
jgi:hypothetical protein